MSEILEISLIILIITFIVMSGFIIKLLIDTSKLVQNLDETTNLIKTELEPALKEVNKIVSGLNIFKTETDGKIKIAKKVIASVLGMSTLAIFGLRNISNGLVKDFCTGLKIFMRR